jgi:O-glycosyl hydrolase
MIGLVALALTILGAVASVCTAAGRPESYVLDLSVRHQVIDNFGANDAWSMQKIGAWSETHKNQIANLLFSTNDGIGLSLWRFNLGAGINHQTIHDDWRTVESFGVSEGRYDWTRQANERWFLRAAKARGVQQFGATVYSPPPWLTRNGLSNLGADTNSTTNLKPGGEFAFARYLTDILRHFRDDPDPAGRISFNYIYPVNEPQWDWQHSQEGCRYANEDLKKVFMALKAQLDRQGLATRILGPESGCLPDLYSLDELAREKWRADYGDYLHLICGDASLSACFNGIITYHSYWSDDVVTQLLQHRQQLGHELEKYPGWKIWQSEYCIMETGRDLGMDSALRMARIIHCDLTLVNASSWQWWNAVSNEDFKSGLIYTDYKEPGDRETIYESKLLWALGNYSRFIRPGMRRVELRGRQDLQGLMASAYLEPHAGRMVMVLVNLAGAPQTVRMHLLSSPPLEGMQWCFTPYITSELKNLAAGEIMNLNHAFVVPARSVVTLVGEAAPRAKSPLADTPPPGKVMRD